MGKQKRIKDERDRGLRKTKEQKEYNWTNRRDSLGNELKLEAFYRTVTRETKGGKYTSIVPKSKTRKLLNPIFSFEQRGNKLVLFPIKLD